MSLLRPGEWVDHIVVVLAVALTGLFLFAGPICSLTQPASAQDLSDLGEEVREELAREYGTVDYEGTFGERLRELKRRVADVAGGEERYEFTVLDTEMVNAFSAPGGFIFLTAGLLRFVESSDELAAIVGHELGHVTADHVERRLRVQFGLQVLFELLVRPEDRDEELLSEVIQFLITQGYSREQELEADRLGMVYAAEAGYDPEGMIAFLERLDEERGEPLFLENILSTHPLPEDRIEQARDFIPAEGLDRLAAEKEAYPIFAAELDPEQKIASEIEPLVEGFLQGLEKRDYSTLEDKIGADFHYRSPRQRDYSWTQFREFSTQELALDDGGWELGEVEFIGGGSDQSGESDRARALLYVSESEDGGENGQLGYLLTLERIKRHITSRRFYPGRWVIQNLRFHGGGAKLLEAVLSAELPDGSGQEQELPGESRESFSRSAQNVVLWKRWELEEPGVVNFAEVNWYSPDGQLFASETLRLKLDSEEQDGGELVKPVVLESGSSLGLLDERSVFEHPGEWRVLVELNGAPEKLLRFEVEESFQLEL